MVLHNPNNWHWVNKDASNWAKQYFEETLIGSSADDDQGNSVQIHKVLSVEGDVDVSQRKGKVIALFDVKLQLEYKGQTGTGVNVDGTITIPEVAHDTDADEYVFEISNYSDTAEKQPVKDLIRSKLTPTLRLKLFAFSKDLIDQHGKDIQHTEENDPKSKTTPPKFSSPSSSASQVPPSGATKSADKSQSTTSISTTSITNSFEFQTSANELYQTFVDIQRVAAFTRSFPEIFEPKIDGKFKLFGGNVEGRFITLVPGEEICQTWRLASWPKEHYSKLTLTFDQGMDATILRLAWSEVPVGQEETTLGNFEQYYVKPIKVTFGTTEAGDGTHLEGKDYNYA
ncbi:hypothetical protein ABW19_dt0205258 [Dactylella cylindrospora]|nr:hypothetical protein ABW19_dt0205258 [Dactylella cylindrospora]